MKGQMVKQLVKTHNFKVAITAVIVTLLLEGSYVLYCAHEWNKKHSEQMCFGNEVFKENLPLKIQNSRQGALFKLCAPSSFVAAVKSCASNQVNNVWYIGSTNGFDCFIHNSDFMTQRFRVQSGSVNANYMMPMTDDVSWWLTVGETPFEMATCLDRFLNGELLPHVLPRKRR